MIILPSAVAKNFEFFYRSKKVLPVGTYILCLEKVWLIFGQKFSQLTPQKKQLQNRLQYSKSLIFKDFEDFIYNIAIRISLFFIVFIFLVSGLVVSPRGGVWSAKQKDLTGNR